MAKRNVENMKRLLLTYRIVPSTRTIGPPTRRATELPHLHAASVKTDPPQHRQSGFENANRQ